MQKLRHPLPHPLLPQDDSRFHCVHDQVPHDSDRGHHVWLLDLVRKDFTFLAQVLHQTHQQQTRGDDRVREKERGTKVNTGLFVFYYYYFFVNWFYLTFALG